MTADDAERILRRVILKAVARNHTTSKLVADLRFAYAVATREPMTIIVTDDDRVIVEWAIPDSSARYRLVTPVISSLRRRPR